MDRLDYLMYGTQYYRAPTPSSTEWERDMVAMKELGLNTIKIWAQWRWNNPEDGRYYFDDLHGLMDLAHENHLRVVINTIFDVGPAWLYKKYPDCCMITESGRVLVPQVMPHRTIGGVPGPCLHHDQAVEDLLAFLRAVVSEFKDHPALEVWDLWNEPELTSAVARTPCLENMVCYCGNSIRKFNDWLRLRYGSIEELNRGWNRNYCCWDEVETPRQPGAFKDFIDWRMFFVETITEQMRKLRDITKAIDKKHPVMCHTVPMPVFNLITCGSDDWQLAKLCDLFGNSIGSSPMAADMLCGAAEGSMVINSEIHAFAGNSMYWPEPLGVRDIKDHVLTPLARGVKGFLFWQFRPESLGLEAPAWGMVDPEGNTTETTAACAYVNRRLQQYADLILDAQPISPEVGILHVPENAVFLWCIRGAMDLYDQSISGIYDALYAENVRVGFIHAEQAEKRQIPDSYKCIYAPFPYFVPQTVYDGLLRWVEQGGTLVSECHLAGIDASTGLHTKVIPGYGLSEKLCVKETTNIGKAALYDVYKSLTDVYVQDERVPVIPVGREDEQVFGYFKQVSYRGEDLTVLGRFPGGVPAVVEKPYGRGKLVFIGTLLAAGYARYRTPATSKFLSDLTTGGTGSQRISGVCKPVRWDLLSSDGKGILFLKNHGSERFEGVVTVNGLKAKKVMCLISDKEIAFVSGSTGVSFFAPVDAGDIEAYVLE